MLGAGFDPSSSFEFSSFGPSFYGRVLTLITEIRRGLAGASTGGSGGGARGPLAGGARGALGGPLPPGFEG